MLYDANCGLCAESVQLVLRHDRRGSLRFAALDGRFGRAVLERHPELTHVDSMLWLEPADGRAAERLFSRSAAALRVARYLGGMWHLAAVAAIIPRFLRDSLYDSMARHRHRLLRDRSRCLIPRPEESARFLA